MLINNAGIQIPDAAASQMSTDSLEKTFSTNVASVHRVTSTFLPLLMKGREKKIVNITTTFGSIGLNVGGTLGNFLSSYKISKAALNMLTVQWANELESNAFTVFAVSLGWLQTSLGGTDHADAHFTASQGARATVDIIMSSEAGKDNGAFRDIYIEGSNLYTGKNPPW